MAELEYINNEVLKNNSDGAADILTRVLQPAADHMWHKPKGQRICYQNPGKHKNKRDESNKIEEEPFT